MVPSPPKRHRLRAGIRLRLLLLVVMATAPFVALILNVDLRERSGATDQALQRNGRLSLLAAEQQTNLIVQARTTLAVLQGVIGVPAGGSPALSAALKGLDCRALMQRIVGDKSQFFAAGVVDADGQVVCHNLLSSPTPFGDQPFFRQVTQSGAPPFLLSPVHIGRTSNNPTAVAATQLGQRPGQGMIFIALTLGWFANLPSRLPRDANMQLTVIDGRDGHLLASHPALSDTALPVLLPIIRAAPTGGTFTSDWLPGPRMLTGFAPLFDRWIDGPVVLVSSPAADAEVDAYRRLLIHLAELLAAVIVASAAAWVIAGVGLWRPLRRINEAADRLAAGDLTARVAAPERYGGEIQTLGITLNLAAERLQQAEVANRAALAQMARGGADYRELADNTADMIVRMDRDLVRRFVSPASRDLLGYEPHELIGTMIVADFMHPDDQAQVKASVDKLRAGAAEGLLRCRLQHRAGHYIAVAVRQKRLSDPESGAFNGIVSVVRDVSEQQEALAIIEESEARYRLLAAHTNDLVTLLDADLRRRYVSPSVTPLLGYTPEEFAQLSVEAVVHRDDYAALRQSYFELDPAGVDGVVTRYRYLHKDGHYVWVEGIGRRTTEGGFVTTIRDLTHRLDIEQRLEAANQRLAVIAAQDGLTGLANRRRLDEVMVIEFRRAARDVAPVSLIMVDVDHFKRFNDTYGHQAGDGCLRDIAQALERSVFRAPDLVARYGGEEMAVLLPGTNEAGAIVVAERLRDAVRKRRITHGASPAGFVTVSIGVATMYPSAAQTLPGMLIEEADQALYQAKTNGRDCVCLFEPIDVKPLALNIDAANG